MIGGIAFGVLRNLHFIFLILVAAFGVLCNLHFMFLILVASSNSSSTFIPRPHPSFHTWLIHTSMHYNSNIVQSSFHHHTIITLSITVELSSLSPQPHCSPWTPAGGLHTITLHQMIKPFFRRGQNLTSNARMYCKVTFSPDIIFLAALAALYLTLVSEWVSESMPFSNFDTESDF